MNTKPEKEIRWKILESGKPEFVGLWICKQSHRGAQFGEDSLAAFTARNGIILHSMAEPQWQHNLKTLFVRGYDSRKDGMILEIPKSDLPAILSALNEYNLRDVSE
jgi:hypothetical protein